jgi:hypothetical protein
MKLAPLFALLPLVAHSQLQINEFSANPAEHIADADGDFPDWIELKNSGTDTLSTAGYSLSDQADQPGLWTLPDIDLAPGELLIVFASKKDRAVAGEKLHTNFSLSTSASHLSLTDPGGQTTSTFNYPDQFYGFSFGTGGYFATPTPGAENGDVDFTDYVRDTRFSVDRGFYDTPFTVEITTTTPGAEIYYTTDGTGPSPTTGTLYSTPISITTTTVVRAIAVKAGLVSSNVDSQSYFFLAHVIHQSDSPDGFPATWGIDNSTNNGRTGLPRPADYEMDQRVIQQFGETEAIAALRHHPTISVVMDPNDLWNESTDSSEGGIYPNPYGGTGNQFLPGWGEPREWERPCSIEFIGFEKVSSKKVNAGIRMAGNFARHPNRYKHHFRLTSRREYGPAKFKGELFSRTDVDTFDDFILRGGNSESWTFPGASGNGPGTRSTVQYIRDQFYKDAQIDMGNLAAAQEYFHLYLNGVYWGFYTLIERVDAHFLSQHLGGDEEDFDVVKQANVLSDGSHDDWEAMYTISRGGVSDAANYAAIQEFLDLDNFIDYMVFNFWAGTVDWRNNWRAGRRSRNIEGFGFQFYNWDGERGLGDQAGNKTFNYNNTTSARSWSYHPNEMHHDLKLNPEYKIRFADRVQKHLFHGGTLSPERSALLYNTRAEEVRPSLITESARWGDRQRPSNPYTTGNEWKTMLDYMNTNFFPKRNPIVISQLRAGGVYPNIDAPTFNQHGGQVPDGFPLLISTSDGTIYYTSDGSDPRLEGGAINPNALISTGGRKETELISAASVWKYNDDDVSIGTSWQDPAFNDLSWKSGASPLGYGGVTNMTFATHLVGTPITTTYYRKQFEVIDQVSIIEAYLDASLDGGGIFYLNGVEIFRDNMAEGDVVHATLSSSDGNEGVFDRFEIPTENLVTGTNTLGIELHNRSSSSSDMGLDIRLTISEIDQPDINISTAQSIRTRALSGSTWSALTEAAFYLGETATSENLVISELFYHPSGAAEDEFIELLNISNAPVSLAGIKFADGITYEFPLNAILAPGERIVLRPGDYSGQLKNEGENIRLVGAGDSVIQEFEYNDAGAWPNPAGGLGRSLVLANPSASPDHSLSQNWLPSISDGGTPGTTDTIAPLPTTNLATFIFGDQIPFINTVAGVPTFVVPRNLNASGVDLIIEVSHDLINWEEGGSYEGLTTLNNNQAAMSWSLASVQGKSFVRARLIRTP